MGSEMCISDKAWKAVFEEAVVTHCAQGNQTRKRLCIGKRQIAIQSTFPFSRLVSLCTCRSYTSDAADEEDSEDAGGGSTIKITTNNILKIT